MSHAPGWGSWAIDPFLWAALLAAAAWYVSMLRRLRRITGMPAGPGHWLFYFAGLLALFGALGSPLDPIGDSRLLLAHMLQHVLLADIAPPLLILGLRAPVLPLGMPRVVLERVARRGSLGRVWGFVTKPWIAIPAWTATTLVWAIPSVFDFSTQHTLVHDLEHATLFYTGIALWWLIITPLPSDRREPGMIRLAYLGLSRFASAGVCLPLTFLGHTMYPLYAGAPRSYGLSALADQRLAGASMCLIEFLVFGIGVAVVFIDALVREERAQAVRDVAASQP
jgi:cytochrome c oxidase assembly factor CtaG